MGSITGIMGYSGIIRFWRLSFFRDYNPEPLNPTPVTFLIKQVEVLRRLGNQAPYVALLASDVHFQLFACKWSILLYVVL